ncbi:MAG TPA: GDSL-type esterase/lipase family protein [Puia sp.]|jgi:lysophospholipase L1-like esterase
MKGLTICLLLPIVFSLRADAADIHGTTGRDKGTGRPGDPNIKYFGRWDLSHSGKYVAYWGGSYLRVNFTGTTVKVKTGNTASFYAKIDDGPWIAFRKTGGTLDLTPSPLAKGTHILIVAEGQDYNYEFDFEGLILDRGAKTRAPASLTAFIEWIGDSITAGYTDSLANVQDYAWVCSDSLHAEHAQIAYPGINLVAGYKQNAMENQYLKLRSNYKQASPEDWDFTWYRPDIVVINLGTNDNANKVPDSVFQMHYISFLALIRTKFPDAEIFALRTFLGLKAAPTAAAVDARNAAGDRKVHYINTEGWLTRHTDDYGVNDQTHPSPTGQQKAAALLRPILAPYLVPSR